MTYEQALKASRGNIANAEDAVFMAAFVAGTIQTLAGAVSPRMVWEGAQKRGMTTAQLAKMANSDPMAVSELMW
jgi:hypothetical protein